MVHELWFLVSCFFGVALGVDAGNCAQLDHRNGTLLSDSERFHFFAATPFRFSPSIFAVTLTTSHSGKA
jgi:hypothetical protein